MDDSRLRTIALANYYIALGVCAVSFAGCVFALLFYCYHLLTAAMQEGIPADLGPRFWSILVAYPIVCILLAVLTGMGMRYSLRRIERLRRQAKAAEKLEAD